MTLLYSIWKRFMPKVCMYYRPGGEAFQMDHIIRLSLKVAGGKTITGFAREVVYRLKIENLSASDIEGIETVLTHVSPQKSGMLDLGLSWMHDAEQPRTRHDLYGYRSWYIDLLKVHYSARFPGKFARMFIPGIPWELPIDAQHGETKLKVIASAKGGVFEEIELVIKRKTINGMTTFELEEAYSPNAHALAKKEE